MCWRCLLCYCWKWLFDVSLISLSCLCNTTGLSRLALGNSGGGGRGGSRRSGGYNCDSTVNFGRGYNGGNNINHQPVETVHV